MRKIQNTEEANKYYKMVNEFIDEYVDKWKVKPSNLSNYLKNSKKLESFLKRNGLSDVEKIDVVIDDIINDRVHMENDKIMKFEKFITESITDLKISKSDVNHEKILADLYNTSLGHINIKDEEKHIYELDDFGKKINVIVYSKNELNHFKAEIKPYILHAGKDDTLDIYQIDRIKTKLIFDLKDIIDDNKFADLIETKLTENKLLEILTSFNNDFSLLSQGFNYIYKEEYKGYHIWELKPKLRAIKND